MTLARAVLALALAAAAVPAGAQLSNRSIAVESGLSAPLRGGAPAAPALAVAATGWLDGELEALARVAWWAAARPGGRGADAGADVGGGWAGTAGLRLSLLPEPLRPQLSVELGWARLQGPAGGSDRLAVGAAAGLEWFPVRDVSLAVRCAVRGAGAITTVEALAGAAAYF